MINRFGRCLAGVVLVSISGLVAAQTAAVPDYCTNALTNYFSDGVSGARNAVSSNPYCFSGSVVSQATMTASAIAHSNAISKSLTDRFLSAAGPTIIASKGYSGMAAGAQAEKWNIWGNVNGNDTKIEYTSTSDLITQNDSNMLTMVIGADYALSPTLTFGFSGSFDHGNGSGKTGSSASQNTNTSGYLLAPYIGLQLTDELALDASAGLGRGKMDTELGPKNDADRTFGAVNLSYSRWFQNVQLTGKLGYLHAEENYGNSKTNGVENPYTNNRNKLDQFRAGVQIGYWINGLMPYAGVAYTTDHRSSSNQYMAVDPIGKNATLWSLGVNFFSLASKVTGGIVYNRETGRSNSRNDSLMANINIRY